MGTQTLQVSSPRLVILDKLASGGMGTVWLAHVEGAPEQLVALKRMHKHLAAEPELVSMFLDEIWLTGALRHPNIVRLVGWGVDREGPYFATEFVVGASLATLSRTDESMRVPMSPKLVMHIGAEVARGLHGAFTHPGEDGDPLRIVHRDLTPSNVLVGVDGAIKITDFGIAKAARKIVKTRTGVLKGKLHYISPEYVRGRTKLDGRSDLYSLGVLMFELLAARRPFDDLGEYELLKHVATQAAPAIRDFVNVDAELANIVDQLRANDPADRPDSAARVVDHLENMLDRRGHSPPLRRAKLREMVGQRGRAVLDRVASIRDAGVNASQPLDLLEPEQTTGAMTSEPDAREQWWGDAAPEETPSRPATRAVAPKPVTRVSQPPPSQPETRAVAAASAQEETTVARRRPSSEAGPGKRTPVAAFVIGATVVGAIGGALITRWQGSSASDEPEPATLPASGELPPPPSSPPPPTAAPIPAASSEGTATPSSAAPAPSAETTSEPSTTPTGGTPTVARPRPTKSDQTKRPCTPMDFDYPNCR